MPANYPVPTKLGIRELVSRIAGGGRVVVSPVALVPSRDEIGVVADYALDDGGRVAAICIADGALANVLAGLLAADPPEELAEAIAEERLSDTAVENWNEIANQLGRLFNSPDTPVVRARSVVRLPASLPEDADALLAKPMVRRSFSVTVDDVGTGTLALVLG